MKLPLIKINAGLSTFIRFASAITMDISANSRGFIAWITGLNRLHNISDLRGFLTNTASIMLTVVVERIYDLGNRDAEDRTILAYIIDKQMNFIHLLLIGPFTTT